MSDSNLTIEQYWCLWSWIESNKMRTAKTKHGAIKITRCINFRQQCCFCLTGFNQTKSPITTLTVSAALGQCFHSLFFFFVHFAAVATFLIHRVVFEPNKTEFGILNNFWVCDFTLETLWDLTSYSSSERIDNYWLLQLNKQERQADK